jgi:SAM-dependent methyltransferase
MAMGQTIAAPLAIASPARQGNAMSVATPPVIFNPQRRKLAAARAAQLQQAPSAARYLSEDAGDDLLERLAFLRHEPKRALVLGDRAGALSEGLQRQGTKLTSALSPTFDLELPWPSGQFDFIAALFVLDTANDLPGALVHMRTALAPGGLAIAVLAGAGSLPVLREAMLAADGDRPAPRLHPQVDVRAGGQLLQRAGFAKPVVDSHALTVRYSQLDALVTDLRAQGLANQLADPGPPLSRAALTRARQAFAEQADSEGRVTETFEVLTLSGWRL